MHLTFVSSEGLEQSALSILSSVQASDSHRQKMTFEDDDGDTDCPYDSDRESAFLVIDENSPLLLNLDPPGTVTRGRDGTRNNTKRRGYNSLLNFKIRRGPSKSGGVPLVVVITGIGMAVMVILGFVTMLQDKVSVSPTDAPGPGSGSVIEEITNNVNVSTPTDAATDMPSIIIPDRSSSNTTDSLQNSVT